MLIFYKGRNDFPKSRRNISLVATVSRTMLSKWNFTDITNYHFILLSSVRRLKCIFWNIWFSELHISKIHLVKWISFLSGSYLKANLIFDIYLNLARFFYLSLLLMLFNAYLLYLPYFYLLVTPAAEKYQIIHM